MTDEKNRTAQTETFSDELPDDLMFDQPEEDFTQSIEKIIDRRIRRIVLRTLLVIAAVLALLFLGISPLMNAVSTNARKLAEPVYDADGMIVHTDLLTETLNAFFETTTPHCHVLHTDVRGLGFSRYDVRMQVANDLEGASWMSLRMMRGRFSSDPGISNLTPLGRFSEDADVSFTQYFKDEIEKLPETAILYLAVTEKTPLRAQTLIDAMFSYDDFSLDWLRIHTEDTAFQGGVVPHQTTGAYYNDELPVFCTSEADLKKVYIHHLRLLLDHPECWKSDGDPFYLYTDSTVFPKSRNAELLSETLTAVENSDAIYTRQYCVTASKDSALRFISDHPDALVIVEKVRYSRLPE